LIFDVLCPEDRPLLARVAEGLRLLEDDALGGGGSRGNGRVSFSSLTLTWRSKDYYAKGSSESNLLSASDLAALQQLVSAEDFAEKLA
jgi:CRISPR-associated protein Csm3